ncbi:hypothetical protein BT69DRAFT_1279377 [Atractiella rhizophila]|nr:hypothetical protein BT69DRAFT_1279377 [Atractiella rhizophila]
MGKCQVNKTAVSDEVQRDFLTANTIIDELEDDGTKVEHCIDVLEGKNRQENFGECCGIITNK